MCIREAAAPPLGGRYDQESLQAAQALKKLLESSDAVEDYSWEGYNPDLGLKIQMEVRNGQPYFNEEPWEEPPTAP